MSVSPNTLPEPIRAAGAAKSAAHEAARAGRFLLHLTEMAIPMVLGMIGFGLLADQLQAFPGLGAAFRSDTDLYILGDALFMSFPMVAWMVVHRHGWQHSLEMAAAMTLPGLAIIALGWLGADSYAPGLRENACGYMCAGMVVYMLFRYDHFSASTGAAAHAAHRGRRAL